MTPDTSPDPGPGRYTIICADALEAMRAMEADSVDAVVTDPPAGIAFMGKDWDHDRGGRDAWIAWMASIAAEALRVAKPGAHALVWALPRTSHWTATAWEDAGWEVRDCVYHVFGSGFPKSHNIPRGVENIVNPPPADWDAPEPPPIESPEALRWDGWGSALKPAVEPWFLLRKPLRGTIAATVLAHGTGALNVGACRVDSGGTHGSATSAGQGSGRPASGVPFVGGIVSPPHPSGRFPSHLIHDGSPEVRACFPETTGGAWAGGRYAGQRGTRPGGFGDVGAVKGSPIPNGPQYDDPGGSAARFFQACPDDDPEDAATRRLIYCPKASRKDRNEGCEGMPQQMPKADNGAENAVSANRGSLSKPRENHHATVKATALMRYLCRLITPPGGTILDPFTGSGSTGKAAMLEGFRFLGIERDAEYAEIATARVAHAAGEAAAHGASVQMTLF